MPGSWLPARNPKFGKKGPQQNLRVPRSSCHKVKDVDQEENRAHRLLGPVSPRAVGVGQLWKISAELLVWAAENLKWVK